MDISDGVKGYLIFFLSDVLNKDVILFESSKIIRIKEIIVLAINSGSEIIH